MNPESTPDGLSKPIFLVGLALGVLRFPQDKSFALEEAPDYDCYPGGVTFSVTKKFSGHPGGVPFTPFTRW